MKKLKPHTIDWAQIDRFLARTKNSRRPGKSSPSTRKPVFNRLMKRCSKLRWDLCSAMAFVLTAR